MVIYVLRGFTRGDEAYENYNSTCFLWNFLWHIMLKGCYGADKHVNPQIIWVKRASNDSQKNNEENKSEITVQ